jgi:subtilisin family serine protease
MRRSRITVLAGTVAVILATASAPAGSTTPSRQSADRVGRYVVLLSADPVASYDGGTPGFRATSPRGHRSLHVDAPRVRRYAGLLHRQHLRAMRRAGVERSDVTRQYSFALNGFAARLSAQEAAALSRQDRVVAVVKDRLQPLLTDNTPAFLGLSDPGGPWDAGILGEDVVVGVVDSGIWPEHPSFADDGTFGPLPEPVDVPCEFGNIAHNPDDTPFACNNKLLGARDMRVTYNQVIGPELYDSARDADGHGTHTTSTTAGDADVDASIFGIDRGRVSGIAPRARVIAYKACGEQGCFNSDTAGAVDQAVADGVDVINFSLGGGSELVSPDTIAFLGAADAGVFVAVSAGNGGPGPGTVTAPALVPWVTTVGASTQDRAFEGAVELGDGTTFTGASITGGTAEVPLVDAADFGNELCLADGFPPAAVDAITGAIVLCKRGENARVDKSRTVLDAGGVGMVLYDVSDAAALVTDNHWVPSVHIDNTDGVAVKDYIAANGDAATAQIAGGERAPAQGSVMADFSSRGPDVAAPDILKPDITAPGVNVLAGNSPTPSVGPPGELFQSISGTSMSSPHIAGIYALIKQQHPDWSAAMAKSAIMTTARQDVVKQDGTTAADPFDFGAGHVRPGSTGAASIFDPGLVYDAGVADYLAFLCGAERSALARPGATCKALRADGFSTDPSDLNQPAIGVAELAGSQTVTRTVTSIAGTAGPTTYTGSVQAPRGFDVSVSPESFTLAPGQSQQFRVTITNAADARVGQWRFGSLTWSGGAYEVRSPIAVAASAFASPRTVQGTGRRGSAAFPIRFGYTGAYDARPHGLAPQRDTAGAVGQDPDQAFDPADPAGTTAQRFRLGSTSYMRWELTQANPNVDLDVYVFSRGQQVGASTNPGTDEAVELRAPRDGVYTVYVHGFQTIAKPRQPYTLRSWQVPRGTRGSLTVRREPASARVARNAALRVAWAGLAPGRHVYFGAVSHHRGGSELGTTVVRVATRGR